MIPARVVIRGETWFTLEAVADCYGLEVAWVREVYEFGLLGEGAPVEGTIAVAPRALDRVAAIRRLEIQLGANLEGIALILEAWESTVDE